MYIDKIVLSLADKSVWEAILDYMQYIENGYSNANALNILKCISQYVFLLRFTNIVLYILLYVLFYSEVLNLNYIITNELILTTHRRLCRPVHELELCKYCMIRNELGMKIIENAHSFTSQFGVGIITGKMEEPDTPDTKLKIKILVSVHVPFVIQR